MRVFIIAIGLALASVAHGTPPPPPQPIQDAFRSFEKDHLPQCERLLHELRRRLSAAGAEFQRERFSALERYLSNLRQDDVHGFRRAMRDSVRSAVRYWADRIVTDVVGFRRVADQIIIESFASGHLRSDGEFVELLRAFWESERSYAWRFAIEAAPPSP